MNFTAMLSDLERLGKGDSAPFQRAMNTLHQALLADDGEQANALHVLVSQCGNPSVASAFDALMDIACAEPVFDEQTPSQWRLFALTGIMARPLGLVAVVNENPVRTQAEVARLLGVPASEVHVEPTLFSTASLFDYSCADLFRVCSLVKSEAELGVASHHTKSGLRNEWLTQDPELVDEEYVMLVAVNCDEESAVVYADTLRALAQVSEALTLGVRGEQGQEVLLKSRLVDGGAPWSVSVGALHVLPVQETMKALGRTEQSGQLVSRLVAATVEEDTEEHLSVRLSVLGEDDSLLAGIELVDLHEPDVFLTRLNVELEQVGLPPVTRASGVFFDVEVDLEDAKPRFFVPGTGWTRAQRSFFIP